MLGFWGGLFVVVTIVCFPEIVGHYLNKQRKENERAEKFIKFHFGDGYKN